MTKDVFYFIPIILFLWGGIIYFILTKKVEIPSMPSSRAKRAFRRVVSLG